MKLSQFIEKNTDRILTEWEAVVSLASDTPAGPKWNNERARQTLASIAQELRSRVPAVESLPPPAADAIGDPLRISTEFRALRESVVNLWRPELTQVDAAAFDELLCFNEAVDRALAAAMARCTDDLARLRAILLPILGHDLRSPLSAMSMSAHYLALAGMVPPKPLQAVIRIRRSIAAMQAMIRNLLEFTRIRFGQGTLPGDRVTDFAAICKAALDEVQAARPEGQFMLEVSGDAGGQFDGPRLQQALANLLLHAVEVDPEPAGPHPVLALSGEPGRVRLQLRHCRLSLPAPVLQAAFDPRGEVPPPSSGPDEMGSMSLWIALFVARQIIAAHGGTISIEAPDGADAELIVCFPRVPD